MSIDLDKQPDYDALFDALVEKTKAGKLDWQETAEEGTFVAAVRGEKTFRVTQIADGAMIVLEVVNTDGKVLVNAFSPSPAAKELYSLARRIALRLDENIDAAMQLLDSL